MYICIHTHIFVYIHICICIFVCIYTYMYLYIWGLPFWLKVENCSPLQETQETCVQSLGLEDALEKEGQPTPVFLLENPMDRGAWLAVIHGVTKSHMWLSMHLSIHLYLRPELFETRIIWDIFIELYVNSLSRKNICGMINSEILRRWSMGPQLLHWWFVLGLPGTRIWELMFKCL